MNYFIIPGNPPATFFYEEWKRELLARSAKHNIFISAYPQLNFRQSSATYFEGIKRHHIEQFKIFRQSCSEAVSIIGHSLGGYFAYEILQEEFDHIHRCYLIHPFLRRPELRGRLILRAVKFARRWDTFERAVMRLKPSLEKWHRDLANVTHEELKICLQLAYHERDVIGKNLSPIVIAPELQNKLRLIYTTHDSWCSADLINSLKPQISAQEVSLSHDFIRLAREREAMAEVIGRTP